jgi:hypothetical protein
MDTTPAGQAGASEPAPANTDKARLAVIADLLADLPDAQSREVIAELPPADRAAIARLLIDRNSERGME